MTDDGNPAPLEMHPSVWGAGVLRDLLELDDSQLTDAFALLSRVDRDRLVEALRVGRAIAIAAEMVRLGAGSALPAVEGPTLLEVEAITDRREGGTDG
jgi:hypothetical protein